MNCYSEVIGLTLNFRDASRTLACVDSMLADGIEKVWIWDNSEDGGVSAREIRQRLTCPNAVVLHESPINLGFAAGVNRALAAIRQLTISQRVFLLNNDARLLPGGVKALCQVLRINPRGKLAYPSFVQDDVVYGTHYYHQWLGILSGRWLPGSFAYASGCALLIALDRVQLPLFDEDFFMYGEDWFLGWHFRGTGEMVLAPDVWVEHEGSASSQMGSSFYESRLVAGHLLLATKLADNRLAYFAMYLGRCLTLAARALCRSLRYRSRMPVDALLMGSRLAKGDDPLRHRVFLQSQQPRVMTPSSTVSQRGTILSGE